MPLTMNAMVDPVRPMLKCGDVKKCGDVAGSAQNVGTSKHHLKTWRSSGGLLAVIQSCLIVLRPREYMRFRKPFL